MKYCLLCPTFEWVVVRRLCLIDQQHKGIKILEFITLKRHLTSGSNGTIYRPTQWYNDSTAQITVSTEKPQISMVIIFPAWKKLRKDQGSRNPNLTTPICPLQDCLIYELPLTCYKMLNGPWKTQLSSLEIIGPCKVITLLGDLCHVKSTPALAHHSKWWQLGTVSETKAPPRVFIGEFHVHIGGLKC